MNNMIKPLPKPKKKKSIKTLRNKADKLYQELGRKMYSECFCGKPISCLHHHTPKSRASNLRYEIKNGVPSCAGCHLIHHSASDPEINFKMRLFMEQTWGEDWEIELRQQRYANSIKTDEAWYQANIQMLQEMIDTYKE